MKACKSFGISFNSSEVISFVGGGGKTTTLNILANELKQLNKKVLVTTTTKMYKPCEDQYDKLVFVCSFHNHNFKRDLFNVPNGSITVLGKGISSEGKLLGVDKEVINDISQSGIFDYILIEADGAKNKPIKAPAAHEPVIPKVTTKVIGIIGLDSLYSPIDEEWVHRVEIFCDVVKANLGDVIDEEKVIRLVLCDSGLFKSTPKGSTKVLFLNKSEGSKRIAYGRRIFHLLSHNNHKIQRLILGSNINGEYEVFK